MSASIYCPDCKSSVPESARFCPGCGRPRSHVEEELRSAAALTGIPYLELLERARAEDQSRPIEHTAARVLNPEIPRINLTELPEPRPQGVVAWIASLSPLGKLMLGVSLGVGALFALGMILNLLVDTQPRPASASRTPGPTWSQLNPSGSASPTARAGVINKPVRYTGSGDDVISITKPDGLSNPAIVWIKGNSQGRHFAVKALDANGDSTGLLVNTVDRYEGIVPLDFFDRDTTVRFEVSATGSWEIEIRSLASARSGRGPGTITGSGDDVVLLTGRLDTARITGNNQGRHFAVTAYSNRSNLLVNTVDPYDGRVSVPSNASVIEISAVGQWTIVLE